jgi:hypothetical protein
MADMLDPIRSFFFCPGLFQWYRLLKIGGLLRADVSNPFSLLQFFQDVKNGVADFLVGAGPEVVRVVRGIPTAGQRTQNVC